MESVRVVLPNGSVRKAELYKTRSSGYRNARVKLQRDGVEYSVNGRVPTKHGYADDRILTFEVDMSELQAAELAFLREDGESTFAVSA